MEFKKNDTVTVEIQDMSHDGSGIGKAEGYTLFIKDAVIGDTVEVKVMKAKKNYGYARLMKVLTPSQDRTEPRCPQARACGGCQLQFMKYEKQLEREAAAREKAAERRKAAIERQLINTGGQIIKRGLLKTFFGK